MRPTLFNIMNNVAEDNAVLGRWVYGALQSVGVTTVTEVTDADTAMFAVTTTRGSHVIDTRYRVILSSSESEHMALVRVVACAVGQDLELVVIRPGEKGFETVLRSSTVTSIATVA